jgi:hypothetical protein
MFSSYRRFAAVCITAMILAFVAPIRSLASDFKPIPPDELKITEAPGQPNAPAIILEHEEVWDDVAHFRVMHTRLKILTEAGRGYANVHLLRLDRFPLAEFHARTVHPDGSEVDFDQDDYRKQYTAAGKTQSTADSFTIPGAGVGDIIEFKYMLSFRSVVTFNTPTSGYVVGHQFHYPYWDLQGELYQKHLHYSYKPDTGPTSLIGAVQATWSLPKGANLDRIGAKLDVDLKDVPPFTQEEHMPPANAIRYHVRFFSEELGSTRDYWKRWGDWWNEEISDFANDKATINEVLGQIVGPSDTPEQKVRKIYEYVGKFNNLLFMPKRSPQQLKADGLWRDRYSYFTDGSKLEGENYGAKEVVHAKTGTREDLTRLFAGLVRAAGVQVSLMRVPERDHGYFDRNDPNWSQLTRELAIVRIGDKDQYLDPGTLYNPYGMLEWKVMQMTGLRQSASGHGIEIASTPAPSYKETVIKRLAQLRLTADGKLTGTIKIAYFGQEAFARRIRAVPKDGAWRKGSLDDELRKMLPANSEVSLTNEPAWETSADPLLAEFKVTIPMATISGKRMLLPMQALHFNQPAMFVASSRTYPIWLDYPFVTQDEVHITITSEMAAESVPAKEEVKENFGYYSADYKQKNRELIATRVLVLNENTFEVEKYANLKGFFDKMKTADDQQAVLSRAASAQGH